MNKLLKIELQKIFGYKTFWACAVLYAVLLPLLFTSAGKMNIKVDAKEMLLKWIYNFPDLWHNLTYLASWFNILLYLLIIILVTNEYMFKTIRQNLIDGLSKFEVILGKLFVVFLLTIVSSVFLIILGLGTGLAFADSMSSDLVLKKSVFLGAYFIQTFGYMTFALFIGTLFKRQGIAIIFFLLYSIMIESIIGLSLPDNIANYLPLETFSRLIQNPFADKIGMTIPQFPETKYLILSVVYTFIFSGLSLLVLEKSDI